MLANSPTTNVTSYGRFDRCPPKPPQTATMPSLERHAPPGERQRNDLNGRPLFARPAIWVADPVVEIAPAEVVKRRAVTWEGMAAEIVQATRGEKIEYRFHAPRHLLVVYEQGVRRDGETFVEGLPRSTLRDFKRKLTFVPAGHEYREWQEPRSLSRVVYFYFDPAKMPTHLAAGVADTPLVPRLFFEDATLWDTAIKLTRLIESAGSDNRPYFEALGTVLAHEVMRLNAGAQRVEAPARGGLAGWQQKIVTSYIEEHLAEQIPLATLAQLVRLSTYYFCRAFKQSFGVPPHRYHNNRRIEQAKILLAKPEPSVTDIGLTIGFSETSSFSAAFRKATGLTPTAYHRSLA
jgi:AraC family transcriptional regulator